MDRSDEEIQAVQLEARCWSRIRHGLKPMDKWMVEYSIHSLVDQRVFYRKINQIFNGPKMGAQALTVYRLMTSCEVNFILREFHEVTASMNPHSQTDL